jgi:hypothetical protein
MRKRAACSFAVKATYTRRLLDGRDEPAAPPHDRRHALRLRHRETSRISYGIKIGEVRIWSPTPAMIILPSPTPSLPIAAGTAASRRQVADLRDSIFSRPLRAGYLWCRASSQPQKIRFAPDSALEGNGFEPSVPRCARTADSAAVL